MHNLPLEVISVCAVHTCKAFSPEPLFLTLTRIKNIKFSTDENLYTVKSVGTITQTVNIQKNTDF